MPFIAECTFCQLTLQSVPDRRLGLSVECPRCRNSFTLAAKTAPVAAPTRGPRSARKKRAAALAPAAVETPPASVEPDRANAQLPTIEQQPQEEMPMRMLRAGGLASFMLGSAAFLLAAIFHVTFLTLVLGVAGFLIGSLCCLLSEGGPRRSLLAAAGSIVGLAAVIFAVFLPGLLGLSPLGNAAAPRVHSGPAVISLGGRGGFRPAAEGESSWVDASHDALHYGDVRVRILSAVVGIVDFEPNRVQKANGERGLAIRLRITNAGIARKIPYTSWGDAPPEQAPLLRDNQGKSYPVKKFGQGWVVKGRAPHSSIPSGKSLDDVIVFESPPAGIEHLCLELPATAAGAEGSLRMKIPRSMIVFR